MTGTVNKKAVQLVEVLMPREQKGLHPETFPQRLRFKDDQGHSFPDWGEKRLGEILKYQQPQRYLVASTKYSNKFQTPVLTAGKTFILGYTDETDGIFSNLPTIIFDDFTTAFKFVNFPFKVKSSAMKMLTMQRIEGDIRFVHAAMLQIRFQAEEHKRYWISEYQEKKIPYPHPDEQRKIASFLGAVDEKIEQLAQKEALLRTYKKGCMQRIFSGEIRFKDNQGSSFPDWEWMRFDQAVRKVTQKLTPLAGETPPRLIELEDIETGTARIIGKPKLEDNGNTRSLFMAGDVLFGKLRPYLRKFIRPNFDGVCSSTIWVFRGEKVSGDFLFQLVQAEQFSRLSMITSGTTMPSSEWSVVAKSRFGIPHPDEQRKIADFLSALDTKIDLVAQELAQVQVFKNGLLQRMFV